MLPNIGSIRLGQVLFMIGCLTLQAQELIRPDDGSGTLTMLYKQPLWASANIHYNAYDGAGWTAAPGMAMRKSTNGNFSADAGWWEYSLKSNEFEFVFNDNNGTWDNNANNNYMVNSAGTWAVVSAPPSTPVPTPPSFISGAGYKVANAKTIGYRTQLTLTANAPSDELYGADIKELTADFFVSKDNVRVKISDKNNKRWEVPTSLYGKNAGLSKNPQSSVGQGGQGQGQGQGGASGSNVAFTYTANPFSFKVTRKTDSYVLFDSSALDLVIKDQYLQIATAVPSDLNVYGVGESTRGSMKISPGEKRTLWARDTGSYDKDVNTYGSHPFYLGLNDKGAAHGVLLLNSNGMDVTMDENRLIYQTIGGILDFSIISGPTPADVLSQYTTLIGKPKLMPYWSYGFHQCRWGYKNVPMLRDVMAKYDENQIPLDVVWADIDYMSKFYDFTLDPVNFPAADVAQLLSDVHAEGKKFVPIVDPGIPDDTTDIAYKRGLELDVFIKDTAGKPYLGQVWPGPTVFPDFFHPNSTGYWSEQLTRMHELMAYDGLWIDMNELANFCPGTQCAREEGVRCPRAVGDTKCCLKCTDDNNQWNHPPFPINNGNSRAPLFNKAISTTALQFGSIRQYDAHNLYGLTESITTNAIQEKLLGKRSFVLSRSTFPGSGAHVAHWTGDNAATWNDIQWSVVTIQNFGLFGIPMVGADICGFVGNSNAELCARWTALGAFYPFARNHNNVDSIPQETYVWPEVAAVGRKFIGMRYRLLPYIYTLGYQATTTGAPIARPLFFEFPADASTRAGISVERQFMLGNALLVVPVVFKGVDSINGYVPAGTWYNLFDYSKVESKGEEITWPVKLDDMPVLVRGGSILPLHQGGELTSAAARKTPFDILVALPSSSGAAAAGQLFLDDGEDLQGASKSSVVEFKATATSFTSQVGVNKYADAKTSKVSKVVVLGVTAEPKGVVVNESPKLGGAFTYTAATQQLEINLSKLDLSIVDPISIVWN